MAETYDYDNDLRPICTDLKSESSIDDFLKSHNECKFPPDKNFSFVLEKFKQQEIVEPAKVVPDTKINTEVTTKAIVAVPSKPVDVAPQQKHLDIAAALPVITGAIAGAISSSAGPMLTNLVKKQLKKLLKNKNKAIEEKEEEKATDCKTHNLQCNTRSTKFATQIVSLETKISALEAKNSDQSGISSSSSSDIEELVERIETLEKKLKRKGKSI
jgi:hypothetical protein